MPDGGFLSGLTRTAGPTKRYRQRWVSPLLRRILLVNALPLALLVVALLYLDQYQNGLLEAQVTALREQARVFAGALDLGAEFGRELAMHGRAVHADLFEQPAMHHRHHAAAAGLAAMVGTVPGAAHEAPGDGKLRAPVGVRQAA